MAPRCSGWVFLASNDVRLPKILPSGSCYKPRQHRRAKKGSHAHDGGAGGRACEALDTRRARLPTPRGRPRDRKKVDVLVDRTCFRVANPTKRIKISGKDVYTLGGEDLLQI